MSHDISPIFNLAQTALIQMAECVRQTKQRVDLLSFDILDLESWR